MQKKIFIGVIFSIALLISSCSIEEKYAPTNEYANIDLSQVPFSNLSDYGFFSGDMNALNPVQGVYPYSLTSPSFADYSSKERFIYLPEGTHMEYQGDFNSLEFPIGTIIIKNFMYYNDIRDKSLGRTIIETRLLVRKEMKWKPFSYKWNDEQTEAVRLIVGGTVTASTIAQDGNLKEISRYVIPRELDCRTCHNLNEEMTPIGPKPANLNRLTQQDLRWCLTQIFRGAVTQHSHAPSALNLTLREEATVKQAVIVYVEVFGPYSDHPRARVPALVGDLHVGLLLWRDRE